MSYEKKNVILCPLICLINKTPFMNRRSTLLIDSLLIIKKWIKKEVENNNKINKSLQM